MPTDPHEIGQAAGEFRRRHEIRDRAWPWSRLAEKPSRKPVAQHQESASLSGSMCSDERARIKTYMSEIGWSWRSGHIQQQHDTLV